MCILRVRNGEQLLLSTAWTAGRCNADPQKAIEIRLSDFCNIRVELAMEVFESAVARERVVDLSSPEALLKLRHDKFR